MNFKGSLSLLVLHLLATGPSHGYRIAREIKQRSAGVLDFREGTLYPTLHGLEQRGLVDSVMQNEYGRARRYYHLTEAGRAVLAHERAEWERYTGAVRAVLGEAQ